VIAPSADQIDALLPQTQCRQCGYSGCAPYAEAIAGNAAAINRCPPGGEELIAELAELLGISTLPPDPACGAVSTPTVALIDETTCIGCTLCIAACPVDAIVGARKWMHTVIPGECTGCALCLPPCPVDCIALIPTEAPRDRNAQQAAAPRLKARYHAHQKRLQARHIAGKKSLPEENSATSRKNKTIARALQRARVRLHERKL